MGAMVIPPWVVLLFLFIGVLLVIRIVQQQRYIRELCRIIDQLEGGTGKKEKADSDFGDWEGGG